MLRLPLAVICRASVAALALAGCDDPQGITRIHFSMNPPNVTDFGADAGPAPVDLFDLTRASGTIQVLAELDHLSSEYSGLPLSSDPERGYLLWLSASDPGEDWTLASELTPRPSGAAEAHLGQADVAIDFLTVRSAVVTLDPDDADEPSRAVVLTGAAGNEPEVEAAPAGGGSAHEH